MKEYDEWNTIKKHLNDTHRKVFAHDREIWWCSLGINIGTETDGKHENFNRPVLILKRFTEDMILVAPITSRIISNRFHIPISINSGKHKSSGKWAEIREISPKRLMRKIDTLPNSVFKVVKHQFLNIL